MTTMEDAPAGRLPPLARETPVELSANGRRIAVLMCTPTDLEDLAAGHLFTRGMLTERDRILALGACADLRVASVTAPGAIGPDRLGLGTVIASGCGSGGILAPDAPIERLPDGPAVSMESLEAWAAEMFSRAAMYRETGGMHCAAVALAAGAPEPAGTMAARQAAGAPAGSRWFCAREDVGRHNAVDKAIGRAFLDGVDFSMACLLTSGRIAADMVLKAVAARIPVVVTRSIPTTAALELAQRAGLTLVGRIGGSARVVYCGAGRLTD